MFARQVLQLALKPSSRSISQAVLRPTLNQTLRLSKPLYFATPLRFQSTIPKPDIESRVLSVFKSFLNESSKLTPTATFKELDLDSLDAVELMVAVEEEFGIEIPDKESDEINSVKDAIDYIAGQSAAR